MVEILGKFDRALDEPGKEEALRKMRATPNANFYTATYEPYRPDILTVRRMPSVIAACNVVRQKAAYYSISDTMYLAEAILDYARMVPDRGYTFKATEEGIYLCKEFCILFTWECFNDHSARRVIEFLMPYFL